MANLFLMSRTAKMAFFVWPFVKKISGGSIQLIVLTKTEQFCQSSLDL